MLSMIVWNISTLNLYLTLDNKFSLESVSWLFFVLLWRCCYFSGLFIHGSTSTLVTSQLAGVCVCTIWRGAAGRKRTTSQFLSSCCEIYYWKVHSHRICYVYAPHTLHIATYMYVMPRYATYTWHTYASRRYHIDITYIQSNTTSRTPCIYSHRRTYTHWHAHKLRPCG